MDIEHENICYNDVTSVCRKADMTTAGGHTKGPIHNIEINIRETQNIQSEPENTEVANKGSLGLDSEHIESVITITNTTETKILESELTRSELPDTDLPCEKEDSVNILNSSSKVVEDTNLNPVSRKSRSRLIIDDSDSENEVINNINEDLEKLDNTSDSEEKKTLNNKKYKRIGLFDSESEDEAITPHNKSLNDILVHEDDSGNNVVHGTNSKEIGPETDKIKQKSVFSMLCDSDSDDEIISARQNESPNCLSDSEVIQQTQYQEDTKSKTNASRLSKHAAMRNAKKSKPTKTADISKKMTAKEAAEQRKEIQSESQRMLRERNISLPYHKPKSHSLKEFLANRPKLSRALPGAGCPPPSVAIKMSIEQLEIISKKLKEREQEVKEFYKSESESENDGSGSEYVPPVEGENHSKETVSVCEAPDWILKDALTQDPEMEVANDEFSNINKECASEIITVSSTVSVSNDQKEIQQDDTFNVQSTRQDEAILPYTINQASEGNIPITEQKDNLSNEPQKKSPLDNNDTPQAVNSEENISSDPIKNPLHVPSASTLTESYDFHLDDDNTELMEPPGESIEVASPIIETQLKESENLVERQIPQEPSKTSNFTYTDLDQEIENFGNDQEVIHRTDQEDKLLAPTLKSKLELLREKLVNDKPRLSGGPDDVIDLDAGVAKPREVVQLMERFAKHATTKKHHSKHKVKLRIVTVESGGDIHDEEVAMNVDSDDDTAEIEEKPGAKLQKLREALQKQMDQKKNEVWRLKAAKGIRGGPDKTEDIEVGEKDYLEYDDEEEEAEVTDEEDSDEDLEDDIELKDQPLKTSAFFDQEAGVSDDEGNGATLKEGYENNVQNEEDDEESEPGEENDEIESDNIEEINKDDEDSNMSSDPQVSSPPSEDLEEKKKVSKRIIKPVDDSDEEDLFNDSVLQKSTINVHLDSTVTADEDDIPPHQPRQLRTPIKPAVSQTKSISDFLTPISFITSIQNLASASKSIRNGPAISPFRMPADFQSPDKDAKSMPQKKLFTDSDIFESQGSIGSFSQTQASTSALKHDDGTVPVQETQAQPNEESPSTQDLLGICSGEFTGVTQIEPAENTKQLLDFGNSQSSDLKCLGQDDMIISQLLDEEELENFKKKFESPVNPASQCTTLREAGEISGGGVIDSDDENSQPKRKRNNQKRIQFSDDESSDEETKDGEEIDLQDSVEIDEDDDIDNVGYDSEENEININEEGKREKLKLADFLEAEAELSESEWGSEDEDENDLDQMEFEMGDTEKFDEDKVKSDLEKIHMRRMLDDDTREVKLLQELLLDDGEMHGTGRQRQFKWKNIDLSNDQVEEQKDDDDIYLDEEESEEQWRKKRHEREMFLKQQQQKSQCLDSEDLLCTSQLLKIGQKFLQRSMSHNSEISTESEKSKTEPGSPLKDTAFSLHNKRGSFLNRSDKVLQRVAEYTKVTGGVNANSKKTTKHFLFQSVSVTEALKDSAESKKRKASEGTPNVLKKLRLNTNLSPAIKKHFDKSERSKKLFNF